MNALGYRDTTEDEQVVLSTDVNPNLRVQGT